jgi:hypothetical protein
MPVAQQVEGGNLWLYVPFVMDPEELDAVVESGTAAMPAGLRCTRVPPPSKSAGSSVSNNASSRVEAGTLSENLAVRQEPADMSDLASDHLPR